MMRILAALSLALSACTYYVELPLSDAGPEPPDASVPVPDGSSPVDSWDTTSCTTPAICPVPSPGNVAFCGRIIDVADDLAVIGDQPAIWCDPATPTATGACALQIQFYAALPFAGNPTGTPPLVPIAFGMDGCGRYYAHVEEPMLGFMAVAVDDVAGNPDHRVLTWSAVPAPEGTIATLDVYSQTWALDAQWTSDAELAGQSFAQQGALLMLFGQAGVQLTEDDVVEPANDYYFSDSAPGQRMQIDPLLDETGANGAALKLNSELVDHSGLGGCTTWDAELAKAGGTAAETLMVGTLTCL
jgi:hypothetical protein